VRPQLWQQRGKEVILGNVAPVASCPLTNFSKQETAIIIAELHAKKAEGRLNTFGADYQGGL
jgi:stress response protein SCP2